MPVIVILKPRVVCIGIWLNKNLLHVVLLLSTAWYLLR